MDKASISVRYGQKTKSWKVVLLCQHHKLEFRVSTIVWKKEEEGRSGEDDVEKFKGDENKPKDAV